MATFDAHKNFAYTVVTTAPTPATSGTSVIVMDATIFPVAPFNVSIWPVNVQPISTNAEIARVTAIVASTLTITRAQELSTARAIVVGDQIAETLTAKTLTDIEALGVITSTITTTGTSTALALPVGSGDLIIFANNATALTVQGITAGSDGQKLTIYAIGAGTVTVAHQNVGASAANRIISLTGSDEILPGNNLSICVLNYDLTTARWRTVTSIGGLDYVQLQVFG